MRPLAHVVASTVISAFVWLYFRSFGCAVLSFISGVCIDIDHLIDYYAGHAFTLKIKKIYCACLKTRFKKLFLVLHSYEIIIVLWIAIYAFSLSDAWKAVGIGLTQHLIFDQLTNPMSTFGYFITYRILMGFKKELILDKSFLSKKRVIKERL